MREFDLGRGYYGTVTRRAKSPATDPVVDWRVEGPNGIRAGETDCGITGDRGAAVAAMQAAVLEIAGPEPEPEPGVPEIEEAEEVAEVVPITTKKAPKKKSGGRK